MYVLFYYLVPSAVTSFRFVLVVVTLRTKQGDCLRHPSLQKV